MRSLFQIFHPEVFQGSLNKRNYFEGWYFKHVSANDEDAFAVIPGISFSEDSHSFIQYIDGANKKTIYFRYSSEDFSFSRKKLEIRVGDSIFTSQGVNLNLSNGEFKISGNVKYNEFTLLPKNLIMPGIMGWYSYVPGMECNHGVVSVDHNLEGSLNVNGTEREFTGGRGYIEKDWGISFPESWIWMQCNSFGKEHVSVMISIAKIPWMGSYFIGFISFISINGRIRIFATYNGAKVHSLSRSGNITEVRITLRDVELFARITGRGIGFLKAPSQGLMNNTIKESIDSEVYIELKEENKTLYSGKGVRAGFEETDKIFTYF
jgi:tocopherol cyclase